MFPVKKYNDCFILAFIRTGASINMDDMLFEIGTVGSGIYLNIKILYKYQ